MSLFKLLARASASAIIPTFSALGGGRAVGDSADLRRISALPRRDKPSEEELSAWSQFFKERLGKVEVKCECVSKYKRPCCSNLLPVQTWALKEAYEVGGILGPIGVGHGKTLLDLLTAMVVKECKIAVLLLPPNLKHQLLAVDWGYYGQHWHLPNLVGGRWLTPGRPSLHVVAFSELSGSKNTDLFERLRPDVVIVDEAHSVRNHTAARTKRFLRHFKNYPQTKLFAWSGTLTSRSIRDYAHLSNFALRSGSPVPAHYPTLEEWAGHLDPSDWRSPPGKLQEAFGQNTSEGFRKRLLETPGVISSGDAASCLSELRIEGRPVQTPESITERLRVLSKAWQRPDGEELVTALDVARCAQQLSCGFFYRWRFPRGEPTELIQEWLSVRKEWHKELRQKLKAPRVGMDSPLLLAKAAIRWNNGYTHVNDEGVRVEVAPHTVNGPLPTWKSEHWQPWSEIRHRVKPETEAVWVDDFLVKDARAWLEDRPGILWYEFDAFGKAVSEGFTFCGPGEDGNKKIAALDGSERVVATIRSHGTGKNLQMFDRNLVANPPSDGATFEQLIGRTHRQGQQSPCVSVEYYAHTEPFRHAMERAQELAAHIESTFGAPQKLNKGMK